MTPFDRLLLAVSHLSESAVRVYFIDELLIRHDRNMTHLQASWCLNRFISRTTLSITDRNKMFDECDKILDLHAAEAKQVETDAHQP
jgi:hypothetical protein